MCSNTCSSSKSRHMPYNEKSRQNLNTWQKGDPNIPKAGRKKGTQNVTTFLKKYLDKKAIKSIQDLKFVVELSDGKKITNAEAIALKLLHKALFEGDIRAIENIQDRIEGKPGQFIDITTDGEQITGFTFEVVQGTINPDQEKKDEDDPDVDENPDA